MRYESRTERRLMEALATETDPGIRRLIAGMLERSARDAGSDDSCTEPFDPDELSARAKAALRWRRAAADDDGADRTRA